MQWRTAIASCVVAPVALTALADVQQPRYENKPLSYWVKCLRDKKHETRIRGANALGSIGPAAKDAVPALIDLLADERSGVKQWKGDTLSFSIPDPEAEQLRREVITALERIGEPARPAIIAAFKDARQPVRIGAVELVERMNPLPQEALAAVLDGLGDENLQVRQSAGRVLAKQGEAAIPTLVSALAPEAAPARRRAAATALAGMGAPARVANPAISEMLRDSDSGMRRDAAEALGRLGPLPEPTVRLLVPVLEDKDFQARFTAALLLARSGAKEAVPELVKFLGEKPMSGEGLLGSIPGPGGTSSLLAAIGRAADKAHVENRWKAAEALGELGPAARAAIPVLEEALGDKSPEVQTAAREALRKIGAPRQLP